MVDSSKVWITCSHCPHTWIAAHLPMEARKACRLLLDTRCPKCGEKKGLFMATAAEIAGAQVTA